MADVKKTHNSQEEKEKMIKDFQEKYEKGSARELASHGLAIPCSDGKYSMSVTIFEGTKEEKHLKFTNSGKKASDKSNEEVIVILAENGGYGYDQNNGVIKE